MSSGLGLLGRYRQDEASLFFTLLLFRRVYLTSVDVLLVDFSERETTIAANMFSEMLNTLKCAIHNKRHGKQSQGIILLHENARP